jgi:polyhydroxybutyrate depolymerase
MRRARAVAGGWGAASGLGAFLLACACNGGSQTSSETHFLVACGDGCADGLACLCGVCTRACSSSDECSALASGAECVAVADRPAEATCPGGTPAFCDLPCSGDASCASLSSQYRCQNGYCRLPSDGGMTTVCPETSLVLGDNEGALQVGDTARTYVVRLPANYAGTTPVPLVLDFHGLGESPAVEAANSGYLELAEQEGFVVAWPQGIEDSWNIGPCCTTEAVDDVGFARALVGQIQQDACIDAKRIYATGYVMGGGLALYLGCNAADVFAGVACSGFDLLVESEAPCQPVRPITEISFRGTEDPVMPYEGGTGSPPNGLDVTVTTLGAVGTFERWAELNQCTGSPSAADSNGCSTYSQCQDGVEVVLCTTEGGGVDWGSAEIAWNVLQARPLP